MATYTVGPGETYTTLSSWYSTFQSLPDGDEAHVAQMKNFNENASITFNGASSTATKYIRVEAIDAHNGVWSDSVYRNDRSYSSQLFYVYDDYMEWYGVECRNTHVSGSCWRIAAGTTAAENCVWERCIAAATNPSASGKGWYFQGTLNTTGHRLYNCLGYDFPSGEAFYLGGQSGANGPIAVNCTAIDSNYGFQSANNGAIAINCVADGCTDGFVGTFLTGTTNNASSVSSDAPGSNPQTGTTTFNARASDDFTLGSSDTVCKDNGSSTASSYISDDVKGTTRPSGSAWDIGFHELVQAAGTRRVMVVN